MSIQCSMTVALVTTSLLDWTTNYNICIYDLWEGFNCTENELLKRCFKSYFPVYANVWPLPSGLHIFSLGLSYDLIQVPFRRQSYFTWWQIWLFCAIDTFFYHCAGVHSVPRVPHSNISVLPGTWTSHWPLPPQCRLSVYENSNNNNQNINFTLIKKHPELVTGRSPRVYR